MKKIWLFALLMLVSIGLSAQKIKFEKTTHQFGTLEKGDPAEYTFTFTNITEEPIKLSRVKASCGCTTPSWPREEVAPGAKGEIKVKYNSNRIGKFTKTITVNVDAADRPTILYIKGNVNPGQPNDNVNFPQKSGNLAFDKTVINIGVLDSDKTKDVNFKVKNLGPFPVNFLSDIDKEIMFDVEPTPSGLTPGSVGAIKVKIDGSKFISYGSFSKTITLYTDDKSQKDKSLTITGSIKKVFSAEELAAMPNIKFENTNYVGGVVLEGEKVNVAYKFTNTGKEPLIIESVKASCGCTASAPKDKVIQPGATSEIQATFDSRGRRGTQRKSITVRSNDPDNPSVVLRLNVEVEQDPFHQNNIGPSVPRK
ncbi:MAG: DUF1573 domain-containing protein [Bacteroidia bacterium]|nr:DUF1573 domain-containing protein [Bacteroidia bacterium]